MLSRDQRRAAFILLGMMLIGMVMETLGVGLVVPVVALLAQSDLGAKYPAIAPLLHRFGNPSHERLMVAGMLIFVAVSIIKTLFLGFLTWRQNHFINALQASLSQRLFVGYLRQPYPFHLQRNSALLIRNAHGQVSDVGNSIQQSLVTLSECLVIVGVSVLLLSVQPLGAVIVVMTLGMAGIGFHRITRKHIKRWGQARQFHEGRRLQYLQEGLGGAKDVKLLGREADFVAQYRLHSVNSSRVGGLQNTLLALPRLWLELLAVVGLAGLVLVMIWQGKPMDTLLPTLGLFGAAAFRLMPSVNRVLNGVQTIKFCQPALDTLDTEFSLLAASKPPRSVAMVTFKHAIVMERVSFQYPSAETPALRDITLSIPRGSSVGFVGGSGAGKSTLVDVILGLLTPTSGMVKVDGTDIQAHLRGWQNQLGYVPQSIFLSDDSVRRNVAFGLANEQIDDAAVWRALKAAQLEEFVRGLPQGLESFVGERGVRLSGGQRQRIGIARALYHDPPVLVLDEATSSLDTLSEQGVMDAVGALHGEKTLIIVAHRLTTVKHCDSLFRLHNGSLVDAGETSLMLDRHENPATPIGTHQV